MKNFDEKAAQEMRAKAYQEQERKRLEVSLQTRGLLLCDEPGMKSKKKMCINQTTLKTSQGLPCDFHTCRYSCGS